MVKDQIFRFQASHIPPNSGASTSKGDSLGVEPTAGGHFVGGYWIAAAMVVIALLAGYYRRRWRRAVRNSQNGAPSSGSARSGREIR